MRNRIFVYAKTKAQISFAVNSAKLISAFVFAARIVQFIFFLNPKFQASSHFLTSSVAAQAGLYQTWWEARFSRISAHL